jgi:hypothetical protein
MHDPKQITYFAETDARNRKLTFGIKAEDRTKHVYVIGKTGMGKSTLLENMAIQDIRNGNGFAFVDPHGKTADLIMEYIPKERIKDVIYFAPFDMEYPISFNVMEDVGYDKRHLVVSGLMSTFKKIWQDAWSARMEYILGNTLLALLEYPNSTLLEVNKMLADKDFRNKVVENVTDSSVKSFWVDEFAKYTDRFASEATPAIQNKIGQFTANPLIRNIIGQPFSSFDLRKVMDERKILIINLSKGRIGESNANLLGSMLITKIYLAAMSRADIPESELKKLPNFYLYVDEFQSFANESFADILSEARKYKLNLTIAHQYIEQMSEEVRAAVFGNVGTMISFRVGSYDAEVLEKEFAPTFEAQDIVNLGFAQIYLKLMIDGIGSQPFSARTIAPLGRLEENHMQEIIESSRKQYTKPREEIEEMVRIRSLGNKKNENKQNDNTQDRDFDNQKNKNSNPRPQKIEIDNNGKPISQNGKFAEQRIKNKSNDRNILNDFAKQEIDKNKNDDRDLKEISLSEITNKTKRPNDFKKPSIENKNSLKQALAGILDEIKEKEIEEDQKMPMADEQEKKSNDQKFNLNQNDKNIQTYNNTQLNNSHQNTSPKSEIKKEIPEEDLKKLLGIN